MRRNKVRHRLEAEDYAEMARAAEELAAHGAGARARLNGSLASYYRAIAERK